MAYIRTTRHVLATIPEGTTVESGLTGKLYLIHEGGLLSLSSGVKCYKGFMGLHQMWKVVQTPEEEELWV